MGDIQEKRDLNHSCDLLAEHFIIPEHFKGIDRQATNYESRSCLASLREIKLPIAFRLKNIEETETTKTQLLNEANRNIFYSNRREGDSKTKILLSIHNRYLLPRNFEAQRDTQANHC